jgi:hypothetical protein
MKARLTAFCRGHSQYTTTHAVARIIAINARPSITSQHFSRHQRLILLIMLSFPHPPSYRPTPPPSTPIGQYQHLDAHAVANETKRQKNRCPTASITAHVALEHLGLGLLAARELIRTWLKRPLKAQGVAWAHCHQPRFSPTFSSPDSNLHGLAVFKGGGE